MDPKVKNFLWHFPECDSIVKEYIKYLQNADILDIGSNIGFFTGAILYNQIKYKSIHLFEPSKEYYQHSLHLLRGAQNLHFNNYGLSNMNQVLTLYKSKNHNIGWNTFLTTDPNQPVNFIDQMDQEQCYLKKLDDYPIDNVDFIKIDVEGFEDKVLEGGINLIAKFKPSILVEMGWGKNHPNWKNCEKQYQKLFDLGYTKINFPDKTEDVLFVFNHR